MAQTSVVVFHEHSGAPPKISNTMMLTVTEKPLPKSCTRHGSIPRFGASPITSPVKHQLLPTITIAVMPKSEVCQKGRL